MIMMVNLQKQLDAIRQEVIDAVAGVLDSTRFVLGPRVGEFEEKTAEYCGVAEAVGVASGTDALHLSLAALGVGPGDEVITTPFTFFATVEAIMYEGAKPVFVDIEPGTFNMDPAAIEQKITDRTKAILPIHMFGLPADMPRIMDIAQQHGLAVVEDCAQAFGADIAGKRVGSFGSAGCFSFYPSKNLGAYGDGGMVVTAQAGVAGALKNLRNHGTSGSYLHERVGFNSRLDELQAAILLVKFKRIEQYNGARRRVAAQYVELLRGSGLMLPGEPEGFRHVYHQYTVRSTGRDSIKQALAEAEVASTVYYPVPLHLQRALASLGHAEGDFPEAERAAREVLSLPMCPELQEAEVRKVAQTVLGSV